MIYNKKFHCIDQGTEYCVDFCDQRHQTNQGRASFSFMATSLGGSTSEWIFFCVDFPPTCVPPICTTDIWM